MNFKWFRRIKHAMQANKKVISIVGTTGVGKSQLSIDLATKFNGEIINADSMQMYVGLDQITNKHPISERNGVPHHVINHVKWNEKYYIHRFKKECEVAMQACWDKGKIPIIVGGTHYYLQSVLFENKTIGSSEEDDLDCNNLTDDQKRILDSSSDTVFEELKKVDPVIAMKFHPNDVRRIRRALEVFYVKGKRASDLYAEQRKISLEQGAALKYDTLFLWLYSKSPALDKRLDARVDKMMTQGGLKELCQLYEVFNNNVERDSGIWQVIGFKEFLPFLEKYGVKRLNEAQKDPVIMKTLLNDPEFILCTDEMKAGTRKYAKKQVKWIKNLLVPELQQEEIKFNKLYVLDASDLDIWDSAVQHRGFEIVDGFLNNKPISISEIPVTLSNESLIKQDKSSLDKTENWVHHTCDICKDKVTGKSLIFVGNQWEIHLKSKKHRYSLNKGKRKREYEEWLENKKNQECKSI